MKYCLLLVLTLTFYTGLHSQCADAGRDTLVCGYNYGLLGSPNNGEWSYLCTDSLRFIEVSGTSPVGLAGVTVPVCGTYQFVYTVDDMGCTDSDTVTIRFEDPSSQTRSIEYDIQIEYGGHSCPMLLEDTCSNVRTLIGAFPPRPLWTIRLNGICDVTYPEPLISAIDSASCGAIVNHLGITKLDTLERLWISSQDAFITTDYIEGEVTENRFLEFITILEGNLNRQLDTSCYPFGKCFVDKAPCVDMSFDTLLLPMPTHIGGRWNVINQNGSFPLEDTTVINQEGTDYRVYMRTGARYFGPNNIVIEVFEVDNQGNDLDLDTTVQLVFFWEEEWVIDTLTKLVPKPIFNGNCIPCGSQTYILDSVPFPEIPTTFCPTLELDFNPPVPFKITGDTVLCEGRFVVLGAPQDKISYEWSNGTTSRFNFISTPGIVSLITVDANGCETFDEVQVIQVQRPNYNITGDTSNICQNDCVRFGYEGDSISTYLWSNLDRDTPTTYCFPTDSLIWIEIEDLAGCFYRDTFRIDIDVLFNIDAGESKSITCNDSLAILIPDTLSLDTVTYFEWEGPGIDNGNRLQRTPTVNQAGIYYLLVGSNPGVCLGRDSVIVRFIDQSPMVSAGEDRLINCQDSIVTLNGSSSQMGANFELIWEGPGINPGNEKDISPRIMTPGTYYLNNCNLTTGCCSRDTVRVGLNRSQPRADAGNGGELSCDSSDIVLGGPLTSSGFDIVYEWSGPGIDGSNRNLAEPTIQEPGQYFLRVVDTVSRCESIDGVLITTKGSFPTANAGMDRDLTCPSPSVTLDASGSTFGMTASVLWTGPGINAGNETELTPTVNAPGQYILTITDTLSNCIAQDTVLVEDNIRLPIIEAGDNDTITCNIRAIRLQGELTNDNGKMSISWSGPGINMNNRNELQPGVSEAGLYILTIIDTTNQCQAIDSVRIIENFEPAVPNAGPDLFFTCDLDEVTLMGELINFDPNLALFSWEGPDIDFVKMFEERPTVSLPGTYILSINSVNDACDLMDTVMVDFDTIAPSISVSGDMIVGCNSDTAILNVNIQSGNIRSIIWTSLDGLIGGRNDKNTVEVLRAGTYIVEVTGNNGCISTDSLMITEWASFGVTFQTTETCEGEADGFVRILLQGGNFPFTFSLDGGPFVSTTTFDNLEGGPHIVEIRDRDGCGNIYPFNIEVIPSIDLESQEFVLNLCDADNLIIGDDFGLTDPSFIWEDDPGANIKRSVQDSGVYILKIFNECDSVEMRYVVESDILPEQERFLFRMPNAFTPNVDQLNDNFGPVWQTSRLDNLEFVTYGFQIFNRWGEMIFESSDVQESWDGNVDGNPAPPHAYFYKIQMRVRDCRGTLLQFKRDGSVTLLR